MKFIISTILVIISLNTHSFSYSKQKIYIEGNVKAKKIVSIENLMDIADTKVSLNDPYSKNEMKLFEGVLISRLFSLYANPTATKIEIIAINDYKIIVDASFAKSEKMLLALKADGKFLTVREKGPARIVFPGKGKFEDISLAKEGINWVWFVKTIRFL